MINTYKPRKEESVLLSANNLRMLPTSLCRQQPFLRVSRYMRYLAILIDASQTIGTDVQVIESFAMDEWANV